MKKVIIFSSIVFSFFLTLPLLSKSTMPQYKWTEPKVWREDLKPGLPEAHIKKILGEPLCELKQSSDLTWFYQQNPTCHEIKQEDIKTHRNRIEKRTLDAPPNYAIIRFINKNQTRRGKPKYFLISWEEPDWKRLEENPPTPPEPHKKQRIKKGTPKYKIKSYWDKLSFSLPDTAVERFLGPPRYEDIQTRAVSTASIDKKWYYSDIAGRGYLEFHNGVLTSWVEPYWPEEEKGIYEDIPSEEGKDPNAI